MAKEKFGSWEQPKEEAARGIKYGAAVSHIGHPIAVIKQEDESLLIRCEKCKKTLTIVKKQ